MRLVRAMRSDIDMACECGVKGVVIEVPIGYPKLKYQFGWTWRMSGKEHGLYQSRPKPGIKGSDFPYDTTRARESDLENLVSGIMQHSPPDAIGIVDTMGCALPRTIEFLVKKMKNSPMVYRRGSYA